MNSTPTMSAMNRHLRYRSLFGKCVLLACFLALGLHNVQAMENQAAGQNCPATYFRLENGLSMPVPVGDGIFQAQSGGLGFSAIFRGMVGGQPIGIIAREVDNSLIGEYEEHGAYIEEMIRESWGLDKRAKIKVTSLIREIYHGGPDQGNPFLTAKCLVTYPKSKKEIATHVGVVMTKSGTVFYELFSNTEFPPTLSAFLENWIEQICMDMKVDAERLVDAGCFVAATPYPRTGQTLKDFQVPFDKQKFVIVEEDEQSRQFHLSENQDARAYVTLLQDDIPYDVFIHEKGNVARRMSTHDSAGRMRDIYPEKVYESQFIGASFWFDVQESDDLGGMFYGMAYIEGRVITVQIIADGIDDVIDMGIEWITAIFRANSGPEADIPLYDVRRKVRQ